MGKKPDDVKHKERLRKSVECMLCLKSLKFAEIMRSLLLQIGNNHNAVLTNGRATPDELSIAMLGLNKLMQELVDKFQKTLKLSSEPDSKWREEIGETSKRRLKLQRTEEKRRKRKELKEQKAQQRNRDEWLKQNKPEEAKESEEDPVLEDSTDSGETSAGTYRVTKVEKSRKPEDNVVQVQQSEKPTKKTTNKERLQKTVENKNKNKIKVNSIKPESENLQSDIGRMPKKPKEAEFELDKSKLQREISRTAKKPKESVKERRESEYDVEKPNEDVKERPTHVVDPFFITESGQPYLSTAVVLSDDENNDAEDEQPEQKRRKPPYRWQEHRNVRDNNNRHSSNFVKNQTTVQSNKKIKFGEDGIAEDAPIVPVAAKDDEGMHPSWVAKQKLKPKIAAYQGTKITFDDDD